MRFLCCIIRFLGILRIKCWGKLTPVKNILQHIRGTLFLSSTAQKAPKLFSRVKIEGVKRVKMEQYMCLGFSQKDAEYTEFCIKFNEEQDKKKYDILKGKMGNIPKEGNYYFLTVNPDTSKITLPVFLKTIQKALSKRWISYYEYVIEQRGETEEELGKGYHTHIIFNKGIKHCKVVLEMQNSFKKILDFESPYIRNWFNLKNIDDDEKERKTSYILDRKADPEKWKKQDMDIIFRQKNGLQKSYKST